MFCHDSSVGLKAIIAIHFFAAMHPYASEAEALTDVLRLSKGMTYKNAIIATIAQTKTGTVTRTGGRYWTVIDVGVGPADADILAENLA